MTKSITKLNSAQNVGGLPKGGRMGQLLPVFSVSLCVFSIECVLSMIYIICSLLLLLLLSVQSSWIRLEIVMEEHEEEEESISELSMYLFRYE